jgi:hypothetical protein
VASECDTIEIGHVVASVISPGERWARVTGFLKVAPGPPHWGEGMSGARIIIREFKPDDGSFPTGDYRRTSAFALSHGAVTPDGSRAPSTSDRCDTCNHERGEHPPYAPFCEVGMRATSGGTCGCPTFVEIPWAVTPDGK